MPARIAGGGRSPPERYGSMNLLRVLFGEKEEEIVKLDLRAPAGPSGEAAPPQPASRLRYAVGEWNVNVGPEALRKAEAEGVVRRGALGAAAVFASNQWPKPYRLKVAGTVLCPACGEPLPFQADLWLIGGLGRVTCGRCRSVVSLANGPMESETVMCAVPQVTPRGRPLRSPELTLTSIEHVAEGEASPASSTAAPAAAPGPKPAAQRATSIGVRMEIGKVDDSDCGYGEACWRVFWQAVDPKWLAGSQLTDGDTARTPDRENVYCLAVKWEAGAEPHAEKVREALEGSPAFQAVASNPPFVDAAQVAREPLVDSGRVDRDGKIVGTSYRARPALEAVRKPDGQ